MCGGSRGHGLNAYPPYLVRRNKTTTVITAASVVAVALLLTVAACGGGDDRVVVPDVAGLRPAEAAERICDAGLTWRSELDQGVERGLSPKQIMARLRVSGTTPAAGTTVETGSEVLVAIDSPAASAVVLSGAVCE